MIMRATNELGTLPFCGTLTYLIDLNNIAISFGSAVQRSGIKSFYHDHNTLGPAVKRQYRVQAMPKRDGCDRRSFFRRWRHPTKHPSREHDYFSPATRAIEYCWARR